ncbi:MULTISPECIES: hypothetical protein [unclassified Leifsonia]|uniref:hypothetical protein n=1 Tax=unclassified Leifsonia TaxID=2663824 RepID=UPI0006F8F87B|nr:MULTISPECIES: hypothetical protein [unclassified Leifsonia]KQX05187.1 hypothetical protein ASC59_13380 [Leifsonia sp. Root1293]KRA08820.1 hypothetical protein ASD61_13380 [Leifsonia sp. Root60]
MSAPTTPPEQPEGARFERWIGFLGNVIAPATLIGALLFYFGYVSSRAQYDYFGVDVDVIGLGTQDYVMRSPQPLLVPLLAFVLVGAALVALHAAVLRRKEDPGFGRRMRRVAVTGLALLAAGVVLLVLYPLLGDWPYYPLVTPLVIAAGGGGSAYALALLRPRPRLALIVLLWLAVAAALFWATATIAQWSGRGIAQAQVRQLGDLPSVIIDTQQRLFLPAEAGVDELELPDSAEEKFRYRYWGLRLLIVGDDRMFLVPDVWTNRDTTLVVPLDGSSRVQFQFRNDAPE